MPEINGTDILVLIEAGGEIVDIGSQKEATYTETSDIIDVSSKNSRAREILYGRYSWSISADALYVPSDAGQEALRDAIRNGTFVTVVREEEGVFLESGEVAVSSLEHGAPDQDGATFSVSLEGDGEWISGT